jgi:hypothetical protein
MGPCRARLTRSSGVKSRNRLIGSGGRSVWPGVGRKSGVCEPTSGLDLWDTGVRQVVRASQNPPTASSAAIARNRCFRFMSFRFDSLLGDSARISGSWRSIWNEGGKFWREAPPGRNEPDPGQVDYTREIAVRSTPTTTPNTQKWRMLTARQKSWGMPREGTRRPGIPGPSRRLAGPKLEKHQATVTTSSR